MYDELTLYYSRSLLLEASMSTYYLVAHVEGMHLCCVAIFVISGVFADIT